MTVIALETADASVRGIITRWLLELKPGVFVGKITQPVRMYIWNELKANQDKFNGGVMVYNSNTEQGFEFQLIGSPRRKVADYEGINLIKVLPQDTNSGF